VVFPVPALKLQDITSHWDTTASFHNPSYSVIIKNPANRFYVLCTGASHGHLLTVTIPDAVLIQFDLLRMSKIFARNMYMYRMVINILKICASGWSLAKVILRCAVSEASELL